MPMQRDSATPNGGTGRGTSTQPALDQGAARAASATAPGTGPRTEAIEAAADPPSGAVGSGSPPADAPSSPESGPGLAANISGNGGAKGNLKRGGIHAHKAAKAAREAERAERAQSRAGILEILRGIADDDDQVGAYRVAASKLLLAPEAATGEEPIRKTYGTVEAWIEATRLRETAEEARTDWTFAADHRCPTCRRCGEACRHLNADGTVAAAYSATARGKARTNGNGGAHE